MQWVWIFFSFSPLKSKYSLFKKKKNLYITYQPIVNHLCGIYILCEDTPVGGMATNTAHSSLSERHWELPVVWHQESSILPRAQPEQEPLLCQGKLLQQQLGTRLCSVLLL